jgi:predicted HicB family RNase H-like nuclease
VPKEETPRYRLAPGPDVDLEREDVRDIKGARIDEQYVREAVENVHRQIAGRPSLTAPGKHSPQIAVRLPEALHAAIEARARREGKSVSAIAREAIEQYLSD